jgi:tRNA pseudouridine55 synthase
VGRRPKWGRAIDGVLLLDKNTGITSNTALQQAKRLFFAKRAGHTGSLDPLATGVLPICFGEATKFAQYLLETDKRYLSTYRFGVVTETGDCDGKILRKTDASNIDEVAIESCLAKFRGEICQLPSMYSALKYQGKPLYQWAREGIALPDGARRTRDVKIYHYQIKAFRKATRECPYPEADVEVHCSKGTYIRTLAEDLGQLLGCGAHVIRLHRTTVGSFQIDQAITLNDLATERGEQPAELLDRHLLPLDAPVAELPSIEITREMSIHFRQGQPVVNLDAYRSAKEGVIVRVLCSESGQFLGMGELVNGAIIPKRVVVLPTGKSETCL